jgi:hypothetical protein
MTLNCAPGVLKAAQIAAFISNLFIAIAGADELIKKIATNG